MIGKPPGPRRATSERAARSRSPGRPALGPRLEGLSGSAGRTSRSWVSTPAVDPDAPVARSNARSLRSMVCVEPPGVVARLGPIGAEPRLTRGPTDTPGRRRLEFFGGLGRDRRVRLPGLRRGRRLASAEGLEITRLVGTSESAVETYLSTMGPSVVMARRDVDGKREVVWARGMLDVHRDEKIRRGGGLGTGSVPGERPRGRVLDDADQELGALRDAAERDREILLRPAEFVEAPFSWARRLPLGPTR